MSIRSIPTLAALSFALAASAVAGCRCQGGAGRADVRVSPVATEATTASSAMPVPGPAPSSGAAAPSSGPPFLVFAPPDTDDLDVYKAYLSDVIDARTVRRKELDARKLAPGEPMMNALRDDPYVRRTFAKSVQEVIEAPDEARLYSVEWNEETVDRGLRGLLSGAAKSGGFGSVPIDRRDLPTIVGYLYMATALPDTFGAACEDPHHALLLRKQGARVAISICFECSRITISSDDGRDGGAVGETDHRFSVDLDVALHELLNRRLREGRVPVKGSPPGAP